MAQPDQFAAEAFHTVQSSAGVKTVMALDGHWDGGMDNYALDCTSEMLLPVDADSRRIGCGCDDESLRMLHPQNCNFALHRGHLAFAPLATTADAFLPNFDAFACAEQVGHCFERDRFAAPQLHECALQYGPRVVVCLSLQPPFAVYLHC